MARRSGTLYQSLPQRPTALTVAFDTEAALATGTVAYTLFTGQTLPPGTPPMTMTGGTLALQIPYVTAASWTSPSFALSELEWYLSATSAYTMQTPAQTASSVWFSADNGNTWSNLRHGSALIGVVAQSESLAGKFGRLMVTLQTDDQSVTPSFSGLSLAFSGIAIETAWLSGMAARLRSRLYSPINTDPKSVPVMTLGYDGGLQWTVRDLQLQVTVTGGSSRSTTLLLPMCTVDDLHTIFNGAPGYQIYGYDATAASLGAVCLIEGSGDLNQINGGMLKRFSSPLWDIVQAWEWELEQLRAMVPQALNQMDIRQANAPWLDTWGGYFGVEREAGEDDPDYAYRIETEPFALQCNNLAMEDRVLDATGLKVQCKTLKWRTDDSRFIHCNALPTYRQGTSVYQVVNDARWIVGPFDSANPDLQFLTSLGITLINGAPYWGDPENGNLLVCAFAVLLGFGLSDAQKQGIKSVIERVRAGGTTALYFQPTALIRTNTVDNLINGTLEVGPTASAYLQIQI